MYGLRVVLFGVLFAASLNIAVFAQAPTAPPGAEQAWLTKPVRLVLGLPPGSGSDLLARALAQRLTGKWGQPIVVENRAGANTIIATESVARAAPDGHTLLFGIGYSFTLVPHLYAKIPFDPVEDFAPISGLAEFGTVLVVNPALKVNSLPELIALAKSQPGQITYGSIGSGSSANLMWEMISYKAGIKLLHVPYKGQSQQMLAVLTNEVNSTWAGAFSVGRHVKAGKLKALAYSASKRASAIPSLPTLAELGYPEAETEVWYALFAPARTPRPVIDRIRRDVSELLTDPAFREKEIFSKGYEPSTAGPEEIAARIRRELVTGGTLVKISGAHAE